MKIRATFTTPKNMVISPEKVTVLAGEPVYWEFVSNSLIPQINWTINFHHDSPFGPALSTVKAQTVGSIPRAAVSTPAARHIGLSSLIAQVPGTDYKYDVVAQDAQGNTLAEDDPYLTVLP